MNNKIIISLAVLLAATAGITVYFIGKSPGKPTANNELLQIKQTSPASLPTQDTYNPPNNHYSYHNNTLPHFPNSHNNTYYTYANYLFLHF